MNSIVKITDVFGNRVAKDDIEKQFFLIIETPYKDKIMNKISEGIGGGGWMINYSNLNKELIANGIDMIRFSPVGQYSEDPKNIILVNTNHNISREPIDYIEVKQNVWKPIAPKHFRPLGLVINKGKPTNIRIRTVNKKFVSKLKFKYDLNKKKLLKMMMKHTDWQPTYGKRVVLFEPDSPWYIDKEYNKRENEIETEKTKDKDTQNINESFEQSVIVEPEKDVKSKKVGFNFNLIACTLLLVVILLVFIRILLNWRKGIEKIN